MLCLTNHCFCLHFFPSCLEVTGAQGFAQWNFWSGWPECKKHSKGCLEQLRHPSHLCTPQSLPVQHTSSDNNFTEVWRAWRMKCLSHSPIFPAADSELTSTFLQWSHQCDPLRVLTPLMGMKLHWISLWACGRRTSGINRTGKGSVAGTETAAFTGGGKAHKNSMKPSYSMFFNTYLLRWDLSSGSIFTISAPEPVSQSFLLILYWKQTLSLRDTAISLKS